MSTTRTINVEVGLGCIRLFRDYLDRLKFDGRPLDYLEGPGFISRIFTIRTDEDTFRNIRDVVKRHFDD